MGFEKLRYRPRKKRTDDAAKREAALAMTREHIKTGPVYATIKPSECYHASPQCIIYIHNTTKFSDRKIRYSNAKEANASGHLRPCERCVNMVVIKIAGEERVFTYDQVDMLAVINKRSSDNVRSGKGPGIRHIDIAHERGVSEVSVYTMMRALKKMGLVKKDYSKNSAFATRSTIELTPLGEDVVARAPHL